MYFLHSFLCRACYHCEHRVVADLEAMWNWVQHFCRQTIWDVPFRTFTQGAKHFIPVIWGRALPSSKLLQSPVAPLEPLRRFKWPSHNVASAPRGVLINFSLQKPLSGPENFILHRQTVAVCTPPTADTLSELGSPVVIPSPACQPGRQKGGGTPKPSKHFVTICKKATRTIVMKSLPDGKDLHQEL